MLSVRSTISRLAFCLAFAGTAGADNPPNKIYPQPRTLQFSALSGSMDLQPPQTVQVLPQHSVTYPYSIEVSPTDNGWPKFIRLSSVSGTAPAVVTVTLDPAVVPFLPLGTGKLSLIFPEPDGVVPFRCTITLVVSNIPPPVITSIVSAATLRTGPISRTEIITIFGKNLGGAPSSSLTFIPNCGTKGCYRFGLQGDTGVLIGGTGCGILYADSGQINAVVPMMGDSPSPISVTVIRGPLNSPAFSVPYTNDTSPGIFTISGDGGGQAAVLNVDGSLNSSESPAAAGSTIQIFGTGAGQWNDCPGGSLCIGTGFIVDPPDVPLPVLLSPVSVTIGGRSAQVTYAGASPGLVFGVLQVNAIVPSGLDPGPQPLVLKVGANDNSLQPVTVAVR